MQTLGNFATTDGVQAFVFVAVLFDAATRTPSFALIQESPTDVPAILWNGTSVETRGLLSDAVITCQRPNDGGGIIRRNCKLDIQTEHSKGYPFFKTYLTKALYYGGQAANGVYFGLYAIDRQFMYSDITDGLFLGYYQIDVGLDWEEKAGKTSIPLIEVLLNDETIVGATDEDIPNWMFMFNPWFTGQVIPKVYGFVPRVRTLNDFPTMSIKNIANSISGTVKAPYTDTSTKIILENNVDQFSSLQQLAVTFEANGYARIKMHDGEVIMGTLHYDSVNNQIYLTPINRATYYAKTQGYTYAPDGETPADWGYRLDHIQRHPDVWSTNTSVLLNNAKNIVLEPNGYMQATVQYFVSGAGSGDFPIELSTAKLQGWDDEDNGRIKHEYFNNAAHDNQSLLSFRFGEGPYAPLPPGSPTPGYSWPGAAYLYFSDTNTDVFLYFIDPATAPGSGSTGDPWTLVGFETVSSTFKTYIRNGFSYFDNNHVYAEGDGTLIKIPTSHILGVTQSLTVYGVSNLCEIEFDMAPVDMGIGATSNVVYVDAMYRTGTNENRTERIIWEVLKESALLQQFAGDNITTTYAALNWLPYIGIYVSADTSVSELLDKICFQVGATFKWAGDKFWIRSACKHSGIYDRIQLSTDIDPDATHWYRELTCSYTDKHEMLEDTAKISFGKLQTAVTSSGYEYIPCYFDADYGGWQDPFYKPSKRVINRAIKPNERKISYKFDFINDLNSAVFAMGNFLCIGHPSGVASVQRMIDTDMTMRGCRWEPMDPIQFRDFPLISTEDETNAKIDDVGALYYLEPDPKTQFLMGALACVEQVEYQFNVIDPVVKLTAKMSQPYVLASGWGGGNGGPPGPGDPPPTPPGNGSNPPGGGAGNNSSGTPPGGNPDPMGIIVSGGDSLVIDSVFEKTCTFEVRGDASMGSGGFTWTAEIDDTLHSGGAVLVPASGSFGDAGESGAPPGVTVTLHVTYPWLTGGRTSREVNITWTAHSTTVDGRPWEQSVTTSTSVTLKGPLDIDES
jgi:hypothetical protein